MQGYPNVYPDPYKRAGGEIVQRWRFKRPGFPSSTTTAEPDSAAFRLWFAQCTGATASADAARIIKRGKITLQPGDTGKGKSLDWLCGVYYGSPQFENLGARARSLGHQPLNQNQRRRLLDLFANTRTRGGRRFGHAPFEEFTRPDIELYLDSIKPVGRHAGKKNRTTGKANGVGTKAGKSVRDAHRVAIRKLYNFAIDRELTKQRNPVARIEPTYAKGTKAKHKPWNDADIIKFRNHWPLGTVPRLAFELAWQTGLRRSDLHLLGDHLLGPDGVLRLSEVKGSGSEVIANHPDKPHEFDLGDYPELRALIRATQRAQAERTGLVNFKGGHWLTNTRNLPFGYGNFGKKFTIWSRAAGIEAGKTLHGIRVGFAITMLAVTGDLAAVSDALGHTNLTTTQGYVGDRDKPASAKRGRLAVRDAIKGKGVA